MTTEKRLAEAAEASPTKHWVARILSWLIAQPGAPVCGKCRVLGALAPCDACYYGLRDPQPTAPEPSADQSDRTHAYLWMRECAAAEAQLAAVRTICNHKLRLSDEQAAGFRAIRDIVLLSPPSPGAAKETT